MEKVDIVYFVEHVARELDIACAVKYLLGKRHGLSVKIASIALGLKDTLRMFKPRVVAIPYCYSSDDLGISDILPVWNEAVYVNLAFEQVYSKANQTFKAPRDAFAQKHILHHAWGNFYAEYLRKCGVLEGNIIVNGNLSFTLYTSPYKGYYKSRDELAKEYGLDTDKRWVFVPENYGAAFFTDADVNGRIQLGYSESDAYQYRDFALASFQESAKWWHKAAELGDVEVVVRPRPATPKDVFAEKVRKFTGEIPPHLHFIKEGTVREWILASDIITSSYSTTLLEASIAEKPLYMLMPIPFPEFLHSDWYDLVPKVETLPGFMDMMANSKLETSWKPLKTWAEHTMINNGDAISNLTDILAKVCRKEIPLPEQSGGVTKRLIIAGVRRLMGILVGGVNTVLGRKGEPDPNTYDQDVICPTDVDRRVSKWAEILK